MNVTSRTPRANVRPLLSLNSPRQPAAAQHKRKAIMRAQALTLSSHFAWTEMPHALHVFPCLLRPQIDDCDESQSRLLAAAYSGQRERRLTLQYAHGVGIENEVLLKVCGLCSPSSPIKNQRDPWLMQVSERQDVPLSASDITSISASNKYSDER